MKSNLRLCSVLVLCWAVFLQETWGQTCTPDPIYINSEFIVNPLPDSIGESCSLNQGILNEPYEQTFTIVFPDSIGATLGGIPIEFEVVSFTIDAILGLPSGVTYTCEPPDCVFTSNTIGCISFSGIPNQVGVYSLIIQASLLANIGVDLTVPIEIPNQPGSLIPFPPLGVREYIITIYPDSSTPQNCVVGGGVVGCTNPNACNFDATANTDDGSCISPGDTCDDGSPFTENDMIQADCSCQGEMVDGEIVPTVGEWGLIILALLLLNIAVLGIRQTKIRIKQA